MSASIIKLATRPKNTLPDDSAGKVKSPPLEYNGEPCEVIPFRPRGDFISCVAFVSKRPGISRTALKRANHIFMRSSIVIGNTLNSSALHRHVSTPMWLRSKIIFSITRRNAPHVSVRSIYWPAYLYTNQTRRF